MDIEIELVNMSPMLQHRFSEEAEVQDEARPIKLKDRTPREQAEIAAYRNAEGLLYHPGAAIARMIVEAGGQHKQRGSRKSLKYIVSAAMIVLDDAILLRDPDTGEPLKTFEVDSRPVVIPATKGRIMRHRPRYEHVMMRFRIRVHTHVLGTDTIYKLFVEGAQQLGLGDYRPQKFGPFGTFKVTKYEELKADAEAAE